mgnify:CR=1 FL=1
MAKQPSPKMVGTIWTAGCTVQVIDGTHWKTIETCLWTPRAINNVMIAHNLEAAWVRSIDGRHYYFRGPDIARLA